MGKTMLEVFKNTTDRIKGKCEPITPLAVFTDAWEHQQKTIESLKAQLAQYQSDDYMLVPKLKVHDTWHDTNEPENIVFKESDFSMLGGCYYFGDIVEIKNYKSAYFNHKTMYGTWNKDKTHFFVGSEEECKAMIEAQEQHNEQ